MARYRGTYRRYDDRTPLYQCPTCKREKALTAYEAARKFQCQDCTRRDAALYEGFPY